MLVLENSAGGGFPVGVTVEELAAIAEAAAARGVAESRLGFCLDTAHLWAAGYCLAEPDETDALLERFDRLIGLRRLAMVHLNDSKSELGSRLDRHEHVGAGAIGEVGMAHLLRHPRLAHVAWYLETPGMEGGLDAHVARANDPLAAGAACSAPPGAMDVSESGAIRANRRPV